MTRIGCGAELPHDVDLPGRRVRAQDHAGRRREERVPHVAGRVVRRHVEQFEVVLVGLDLAAAVDLEAHVGEDAEDPPHDLRGGVQSALDQRSAGQRHIDDIGSQAALQIGVRDLGSFYLFRSQQRLLDHVDGLAVCRSLRCRQGAQLLECISKLARSLPRYLDDHALRAGSSAQAASSARAWVCSSVGVMMSWSV